MKAYEERPKSAFSEKDTITNLKTPLTNGEKWVTTVHYDYGKCTKQKVIKETRRNPQSIQVQWIKPLKYDRLWDVSKQEEVSVTILSQ